MKNVVFLLSLVSVLLFSGCMESTDDTTTYYLTVPVNEPDYEFLGNLGNAISRWEQYDEELYHVRFRDYSEMFLFDCVATVKNPRLMGGFEFTNLTSGDLSALPTKGVRGYSYITYRYNPSLEFEEQIRISFREEGNPSQSKAYTVTGLYVTNTAITSHAILNGDSQVTKFGKDDYLKLTIYNSNKNQKVEVMLAEGTKVVSDWKYVKLGSLGATDGLIFELTSSAGDIADYPSLSYFSLDGIIMEDK